MNNSPAVETIDAHHELKPLLRGVSHQVMTVVAAAAASGLVVFHWGTRAMFPALIYGLSLTAMFASSAIYHRTNPPYRVKKWLERIDHAMIFVFISGTYTPLCAMLPKYGNALLIASWTFTALGVARGLFWVDAPRWISVAQYLLAGWMIAPFVPELAHLTGALPMTFLAIGGIAYSLGAVVFARSRPNPFPKVFGFHEIFHALVVLAAVFHYFAVVQALGQLH